MDNIDAFTSLIQANTNLFKVRAIEVRTIAVENTHKLLVLFASLKKLEEFWELILLPNKFIAELTEKLLVLCSESDESIRILVAEVFQMIVKQFLS